MKVTYTVKEWRNTGCVSSYAFRKSCIATWTLNWLTGPEKSHGHLLSLSLFNVFMFYIFVFPNPLNGRGSAGISKDRAL